MELLINFRGIIRSRSDLKALEILTSSIIRSAHRILIVYKKWVLKPSLHSLLLFLYNLSIKFIEGTIKIINIVIIIQKFGIFFEQLWVLVLNVFDRY